MTPAAVLEALKKKYPEKYAGVALDAAGQVRGPAPRLTVAECPHRSAEPVGKVECKSCGGRVSLKVYGCAVHGTCTIGTRADGVAGCCAGCSDRPAAARPPTLTQLTRPAPPEVRTPGPLEWVSVGRLAADARALAAQLPADCAGVVGVPRSGMAPAGLLATLLHLPLYTLDGGKVKPVGHGHRGRALGFPTGAGPLAVVDDTAYGGLAMSQARAALAGRPAVFAAVYVTPWMTGAVDHYARVLPPPHLLEWNLMNNGPFVGDSVDPRSGAGVGLDLDGVIVHDHASGGPAGAPYMVPRTRPCRLICTGRRERHRAVTEAQLRAVGAKWDRLAMLPDDQDDRDAETIAAHKAHHYAASALGFFVESDPYQARRIFERTGRPVVCPVVGRVWQTPPPPAFPAPEPEPVAVCRACAAGGLDAAGGGWWRCRACGSESNGVAYRPAWYGADYPAALLAAEGAAPAANHEHTAAAFDRHAPGPPGRTLLDVGCGAGTSAAVMRARGWAVATWDVAAEGRPAGTAVSAEFRAAQFARPFDAVLCREAVEHAPDPHHLLRELAAATAPGGILLLTTPRPVADRAEWRVYQPAHLCVWAPAAMTAAVRAAGFEVLEAEEWELGLRLVCRRPYYLLDQSPRDRPGRPSADRPRDV